MPDTPRPRFDPTVSLGALIQIGVLVLGFTSYLLTSSSRIDQTAREVQDLKSTVATQAVSTRDSIRESMQRVESNLSGINSQIQTLSPMTERVRRIEADLARLQEVDADMSQRIENRRNTIDLRIESIQRQLVEATTRLESLSRSSAPNLPGSPGVRR